MWVFVGPRSCMNAAGCCGASGDSSPLMLPVVQTTNIISSQKNPLMFVHASSCGCLPGYCEASRTKPPPGLLLSLRSPPIIKHRKRKRIDQECDSTKNSVTFITFHVLHHAVNAEQRAHERKEADRGKERKRNGPVPALCY